jgi:hypothetical protein
MRLFSLKRSFVSEKKSQPSAAHADTVDMKKLILLLLATACSVQAQDNMSEPDEVTRQGAFYEGEKLNYVMHPPSGYRMVDDEATQDGYSFAFVPDSSDYSQANVIIGVNIYKIRGLAYDKVIIEDTLALRRHYGDSLSIWEVDSVYIGSGQPVTTFYLNDHRRFIPNVMISYLNGGSELLIFELVITDHVFRVNAEEKFISCLKGVSALERRELGQR